MNSLLIYSPKYPAFSYGPGHPLRPQRLYLAWMLMESCGLLAGPGITVAEPEPATFEDCLRIHSGEYLSALERANEGEAFAAAMEFGLGYGDNPVFKGVYDWSLLVCGGTLMAVREAAAGSHQVTFHFGGGLHHAFRSRAAGFCYLNDAAVAIAEQVAEGKRILYLDVDAHHGDGVQEAFYGTDRVLTLSFHQSGDTLFPGTGRVDELGRGKGRGFSLNVPLLPGSGDAVFLKALNSVLGPVIQSFAPDLMVVQLGVDTMGPDPLAQLQLTTVSLEETINGIRDLHSGPLAVLGGGGYHLDTVARAWTLAWCLLSDQDPPGSLPDRYIEERAAFGALEGPYELRDPDPDPPPDQNVQMQHLEEVLGFFRTRGIIP